MWKIIYDNGVGPDDEGFWKKWTVTDGNRFFDCDSKEDAEWLCNYLNTKAT